VLSRLVATMAVAVSLCTVPNVAADASPGAGTPPTIAQFTGEGFDKCLAPSTGDMRSWLASPYRVVNIYFGGINRACDNQPELTPQWVSTVTSNGWGILPTFVGLQSRCQSHKTEKFTEDNATAKGTSAADNAVDKLVALGIGAGNPVYYDMEPFNTGNASCNRAAAAFISAWTAELHALGYVSGLYAHPTLGLKPMVNRSDPKPDDVWFPDYPPYGSWITDDTSIYAGHRIHQYNNSHNEVFSGVTFQIDNDAIDADVVGAVVPDEPTGPPYVYAASPPSGQTLKARSTPAMEPDNRTGVTYAYGEAIEIECQAAGETLHGSYVWDRLTDGTYVNDINTTTTGGLGFTLGIPKCDKAPPTVTPGAVQPATLAKTKTFTWSADDPDSGIGAYDARYRTAPWSGAFGDWTPAHGLTAPQLTVSLLPGTTTCLQVRAIDRSGNVSGWSSQQCVARPLDDRSVSAVGAWTQGTAAKYYLNTITSTASAGARLDLRGAKVRRVGVVATTCRRCGQVEVFVGSRTNPENLVGTLSLRADSKRHRTILLLPPFALEKKAIHVVTANGKKVRFDGLVVSRR
jgi:hypothetical protein